MRITFIVSSLHAGGAERVACLLANQWRQTGHQVTFIVTFSGRGDVAYELAEGIRVSNLADQTKASVRNPIGQFRRLRALRKLIIDTKPDTVISFLSRVNVATVLATRGLPFPVIVSERTYPPAAPPPSWFFQKLRRWCYQRASCVVVQTEAARQWLRQLCPNANAAVLANPLKLPLATGSGAAVDPQIIADSSLIISVGRLVRLKGHHHLVNAFASIDSELSDRWCLAIVGDGPEAANLQALIDQHQLASKVRLLGNIANVSQWLERADIYVHSAEYEGFPNSLIEAMAHNTACLAIDCPVGPREVIAHRCNGLLVSAESPDQTLVAPLLRLMRDGALRNELASAAGAIITKLDAEKIAQQWLNLMAEHRA